MANQLQIQPKSNPQSLSDALAELQKDPQYMKNMQDIGVNDYLPPVGPAATFNDKIPENNYKDENVSVPKLSDAPPAPNSFLDYFKGAGDRLSDNLDKSIKDFNPLELVGGVVNTIIPPNEKGQSATDNPDNLINKILGLIPPTIAPHTLGAVENLLGLKQPKSQNGVDLYKDSAQNIDPQLKDKANQDYNKMLEDQKIAPFSEMTQNMYNTDQTAFAQDKAAIDKSLETQNLIGKGNAQQSQAFKDAGNTSMLLRDTTSNLYSAIQEGDARHIETILNQLVQEGKLGTDPKLSQAASEGALLKYISSPNNVDAAAAVKGKLKGLYENAAVKSKETERIARQILPLVKDENGNSNFDTNHPSYAAAKNFAPTLGEPNGGLPDQKSFNKLIDSDDWSKLYNENSNKQNKEIGSQTGQAMIDITTGELKGGLKAALNSYQKGLGDKFEQHLINDSKPPSDPKPGHGRRAE